MNSVPPPQRPVQWLRSVPYFMLHLAAAGALFFPLTRRDLTVFALTYCIKMFGICAGYHRYFSHRSYKLGRFWQFAMAWISCLALENGVLWWASHHRFHHRNAESEHDPHSPSRGFWWSQLVWIFAHRETRWSEIRDLSRFPELVWLDRYNQLPAASLGLGLWLWGGAGPMLWGFAASTVAAWHFSSMVNSVCHLTGTRPYDTPDTSRNVFWLAPLTFGESWHNNHHHAMGSARQGFRWWELDIAYAGIKLMEWVGIAKDVRSGPRPSAPAIPCNRAAARPSEAASPG